MKLVGASIRDIDPVILEMGLHLSSGSPQHMTYQYPGSLVGQEERVTLRLDLERELIVQSCAVVETRTDHPFEPTITKQPLDTVEDVLDFAEAKGSQFKR